MLAWLILAGSLHVVAGPASRPAACRALCSCVRRDGALDIGCEARGLTSIRQLPQPVLSPAFRLFLTKNTVPRLATDDFSNFSAAILLDLSNCGLRFIQSAAFRGLNAVKKLYLSNNRLEVLRNGTLLGLDMLEYLQADYNSIRLIMNGTFNQLLHLKVLILNDNLLRFLPEDAFRGLGLTHLDLRGNRLKQLPHKGILEHLSHVLAIQLDENPWNCSCGLLPMYLWLEQMPHSSIVGEIMCESPFRLHGKHLNEIPHSTLCPHQLPTEFYLRISEQVRSNTNSLVSPVLQAHHPVVTTLPTRKAGVTMATEMNAVGKFPSWLEINEAESSTAWPVVFPMATMKTRPSQFQVTARGEMLPKGPQTLSPIPVECPDVCRCLVHMVNLDLSVNCRDKGLERISALQPRPNNPDKLYLSGNHIHNLMSTDFFGFQNLDLLHLGNNRISYIETGVFWNLTKLRRLYLNGNDLARLTASMFSGLTNLQYLYLERNVIRDMQPGTLRKMPNLQLLFLGHNLLRAIPVATFYGLPHLVRLSLRGNHLAMLSVRRVLDQLHGLIQVDLQENPWQCSCTLMELRQWARSLSTGVLVGGLVCESPLHLAGRDLRFIPVSTLCPNRRKKIAQSMTELPTEVLYGDGNQNVSFFQTRATPVQLENSNVPVSVVILGLLLLILSMVFATAGLFVYVLKKRRKPAPKSSSEEREDVPALCMHYGLFGQLPSHAVGNIHVGTTDHHLLEGLCKDPIYVVHGQKLVSGDGKVYCDTARSTAIESNFEERAVLGTTTREPKAMTLPGSLHRGGNSLYCSPAEASFHVGPTPFLCNMEIPYQRVLDLGGERELQMPRGHILSCTNSEVTRQAGHALMNDRAKEDYLELKSKLQQAETDYLEVLENETKIQ
uniref:SLIT and NTRK-like protein 1 n=1 Tax=Myxine glutinosa TaxID=7769 RepID=UPI00358F1CF5